jgi:hypothetical protein
MANYEVTVQCTEEYILKVTADNIEDAIDNAEILLDIAADRGTEGVYHNTSKHHASAYEVQE